MAAKNSTKHGNRFIDLTGQEFGKWTVLEYHSTAPYGAVRWLCRCECGEEVPVLADKLRGGGSRGCKQCAIKHGKSHTPEYRAWGDLRNRCCSPSSPEYRRYGGRGISICDRWRDSFMAFFEDMGPRPSSKHSVDRIDNDGDYCPENCRWATKKEQSRNTSTNRFLTYDGKTMCIAGWAEETGIKHNTIYARLMRGWSVERTLATPVSPQKH